MRLRVLKIYFTTFKTSQDVHLLLKSIFGFPDFYGENFHVLVDCLSSLKYPDEEMTSFNLEMEESLILHCINISKLDQIQLHEFIYAIVTVNNREELKARKLMLLLYPSN